MGQRRVDTNALSGSGKHSVRTCRNLQGMYSNDLGVPRVNMGILSIIEYDAGALLGRQQNRTRATR
jgi:hypothetical protein